MAKNHALKPACQDHEADLILLHYGDLMGADRERLSQHVAQCAACAGYLRELAVLMPLTAKTDNPPQVFWSDYSRELRHKLDHAVEKNWWNRVSSRFAPSYLVAVGSAAVVVLALSFTLGKNIWSGKHQPNDEEIAELLPVAENLEFFSAMDILDDMELLEFIGNQTNDNVAS